MQKCILIGFSDRVARRLDAGTLRCELVHGRRGTLARESVVQSSPLLVAAEVREVEGKDKSVNTLLSLATAIEEEWLRELFPEDIAAAPRVFYDAGHQARLCRGAAPLPRPGHRRAPRRAAAGGCRRPAAGRRSAGRPAGARTTGTTPSSNGFSG